MELSRVSLMVIDKTAPSNDDVSLPANLANEARVLAFGVRDLPHGMRQAVDTAIDHPWPTVVKLGVNTAIGVGIGVLSSRLGPFSPALRALGAAGGINMAFDLGQPVATAMRSAWGAKDSKVLDGISAQLATGLGAFAVDTTVQLPAVAAGAMAGSGLRNGFRSWASTDSQASGVQLNFKVDPQYLAYHTLVNTTRSRFVNFEPDAKVVEFQDKAWEADRDSYNFLRNTKILPGGSPLATSSTAVRLESLKGQPGAPGRAYEFLQNMTREKEFKPLYNDALQSRNTVRDEWQANYPKSNAIMTEILGFQPQHNFDVFITHPSLRAGRYADNAIIWTNRNDFPNYNTVYLWHETLHGEPKVDGVRSDLSHSVIQLLTDNELRVRLNGGTYGADGNAGAPTKFIGHGELVDMMSKLEPQWRRYLADPNKDIGRFIDAASGKEEKLLAKTGV